MTSIKSKAEKRYSKIRPSYIIIFKLQFPHTHKFSIFSKIPNHLLYFELIVSDICFMLLTKKIFFFAFDGAGRVHVSRDAAKMLLSTTICAFRMHQNIPMYFIYTFKSWSHVCTAKLLSWQRKILYYFTATDFLFKSFLSHKVWNKEGITIVHVPVLLEYIFCYNTVSAWKVSKYGVIFGPHFPVFRLNTEIYGVNRSIQSEYKKMRTRNNSVSGHYSRSVWLLDKTNSILLTSC